MDYQLSPPVELELFVFEGELEGLVELEEVGLAIVKFETPLPVTWPLLSLTNV